MVVHAVLDSWDLDHPGYKVYQGIDAARQNWLASSGRYPDVVTLRGDELADLRQFMTCSFASYSKDPSRPLVLWGITVKAMA